MKNPSQIVFFAILTSLPTVVTANDFTGARIETHVGYDEPSIGFNSSRLSDSGIVYGVGAGYDLGVGERFIVGIDANVELSTTGSSSTRDLSSFPGNPIGLTGSITNSTHFGRDLSIGARAGVIVRKKNLIYVGANYSNARRRDSQITSSSSPFLFGNNFNFVSDLHGWRVNAGIEHKLRNGFFAKIEYRHSDYQFGDRRDQVFGGFGVRF